MKEYHRPVYRSYVLPPPAEYEEGDLFVHIPAQTIYLREGGNWVAVGTAAAVTDAQNVGGGEGEVYRDKTGSILNFRTLTNGDGRLAIATSSDVVTLDLDPATANTIDEAVQGGINLGAGARVFSDKLGTNLRFRTLKSNDGSVAVAEDGDEIDFSVDMAAAGAVTDAQNVGGGTGEIYRDKTGSIINLRTLEPTDGAIDIQTYGDVVEFYGADGENVGGYAEVFKELNGTYLDFRTLRGVNGTKVTQYSDHIDIEGPRLSYITSSTRVITPNYDGGSGRWWIHGNESWSRFSLTANADSNRTSILVLARVVFFGNNVEADMFWLGILSSNAVRFVVTHGADTVGNLWGEEHVREIQMSTVLRYDAIANGTQTWLVTAAGNATSQSDARFSLGLTLYNIF